MKETLLYIHIWQQIFFSLVVYAYDCQTLDYFYSHLYTLRSILHFLCNALLLLMPSGIMEIHFCFLLQIRWFEKNIFKYMILWNSYKICKNSLSQEFVHVEETKSKKYLTKLMNHHILPGLPCPVFIKRQNMGSKDHWSDFRVTAFSWSESKTKVFWQFQAGINPLLPSSKCIINQKASRWTAKQTVQKESQCCSNECWKVRCHGDFLFYRQVIP